MGPRLAAQKIASVSHRSKDKVSAQTARPRSTCLALGPLKPVLLSLPNANHGHSALPLPLCTKAVAAQARSREVAPSGMFDGALHLSRIISWIGKSATE